MKASVPKEGGDSAHLHDRLDRIYGVWNDVRARRAGSPAIDLESMAGLIGLVSILPLIPIDSALLGYLPEDGMNRFFRFVDARTVLGLLGACFVFQAWSIDRGLAALTAESWSVRRWVGWLRPMLAGVPIAGLFVIPVWHVLLRQRPSWAFREDSGFSDRSMEDLSLSVGFGTVPRRARLRWFLSLWNQLGLLFLGLLATMVWAEWAWHSKSSTQLILGSVAFHGLGFATVFYFLWRQARRTSTWPGRSVPFLAVLWLVPLPLFALFGMMISALADYSRSSMAPQALEGGGGTSQWILLKQKLHRSWQDQPWWRRVLPRRVELKADAKSPESASRVMLLARLKCFMLLPDGAALTQLVIWFADDRSHFGDALALALAFGFGMSLILSAVAVIMIGVRFSRNHFRGNRHQLPYFSYTAAGHLSFITGFLLIGFLNYGHQSSAVGVLVIYGMVGLLYFGLWVIFRDAFLAPKNNVVQPRESLLWSFGMSSFVVTGLNLSSVKAEAVVLELVLDLVFILSLGGAIAGLILLEWLLRPRSLQDVFDRAMPIRIRAKIALMAASAVLPLGGFLVPVWLYLRRGDLEAGSSHSTQRTL